MTRQPDDKGNKGNKMSGVVIANGWKIIHDTEIRTPDLKILITLCKLDIHNNH